MAIIMAIGSEGECCHCHTSLQAFKFSPPRAENIGRAMEDMLQTQAGESTEKPARRRVERAVFETDRQLVEGDLTLPPAGYQSRFSDSLNRGEFEFVPLTNARLTSLDDGKVNELPFVVLSKRHIRVAYPAEQ
jgi:hypothetical protein